MKRIGNLMAVILLVVGVFFSMNYSRAASIDVLLLPYQNIIDQVNQELGSSVYIPDENKEKAYNSIKNMSPSEFEARIFGYAYSAHRGAGTKVFCRTGCSNK